MDTYLIQRRYIIVITMLGVVTGVSGFLDFTCFSRKTRIYINGDDNTYIGGYNSGSDTGATVSFGRTSDTGTSNGQLTLPSESSEIAHESELVFAKLLQMPRPVVSDTRVQRIGAFYCNADKNGVMERITTVIMSTESVVRPRKISQTVSVGEQVTFIVDKNADVSDLRWRHNGNEPIESLNNRETYTIQRVTASHAGVYECYQNHERGQGIHAIILLTVRACPSGTWGTSCNQLCPVCRNGGICDERSGGCVCAPGFSGTNCETVHGRNKWGQDGQLRCAGSHDHTYACQGTLLCLPHPYGCSCPAGFNGLDCDQECDVGTYGANCRSQCHCADGVSCLKDTGECDGGQCHPDWFGINCQEQYCANLQPITSLGAFVNTNTIVVQWNHHKGNDSCSNLVDYIVAYTLTTTDGCLDISNPQIMSMVSVDDGYILSGLEYYSTYTITVSARRRGITYNSTSQDVSHTTEQTVPDGPPINVIAADIASNTIRFEWLQPKCGERRGQIEAYSYSLVDSSDEVIVNGRVSSTVVLIDDLKPFQNYTFTVSALTARGSGPPSEELVVTTQAAVSSAPTHLTFANISKDSMSVKWKKPRDQNGIINGYSVLYFVIAKPYDLSFVPNLQSVAQHFVNNDDNQLSFTIEDLLPSTKYQVRVAAYSDVGQGDNAIDEQFTLPANKEDMTPLDMSSFAKSISEITSSTVVIQVPKTDSEFATGYQIGVTLRNKWTCDKQLAEDDDLGHYCKTPNSYVAAELPKEDVMTNPEFIIGDNNTYGSFYNPPLQLQATYSIYVGLISRINETTYGVSWSEGADVTLKNSPSDKLTNDPTPIWFFPACAVVSVILLVMLTILLTMAFKIRSMKKTIKILQSKTSVVADTNVKKPDIASGQVVMSSDGYVEYKASQQDDSTYQDLGDDSSEKQQGIEAEYAYVNESVIKESKTFNDDYEVAGNK